MAKRKPTHRRKKRPGTLIYEGARQLQKDLKKAMKALKLANGLLRDNYRGVSYDDKPHALLDFEELYEELK